MHIFYDERSVQDLEKKEEEEEEEDNMEEEEEEGEDDLKKPAWVNSFRVPKEDIETGDPYLPTEE